MTKDTYRVVQGYMNLTPAEQADALREIEDYNGSTPVRRKSLGESLKRTGRVLMGPVDTACVCCGR